MTGMVKRCIEAMTIVIYTIGQGTIAIKSTYIINSQCMVQYNNDYVVDISKV